MDNLNSVFLSGRLVKDPISFSENVAVGVLAVNREFVSNGEKVKKSYYINLKFYGKSSRSICKYGCKGKGLTIEGRLEQEVWDKGGQTVHQLVVVVEKYWFLPDGKRVTVRDGREDETPRVDNSRREGFYSPSARTDSDMLFDDKDSHLF